MQTEAAKAAHLIQLIVKLEQEEGEITDTRQRWYDEQRYAAEKGLQKNSRYQQLQIELKITLLQKEAEVYEAALADE